MKRTHWTAGLLASGLLMGTVGALRSGAQPGAGKAGGASMGMGMAHGMGMHRQMMSDSCPMGAMMMHGMMDRSMTATEDGGVVVMVGNQLFKYDRNLALKKEAVIKLDTARLRASMRDAMRACPMMEMTRDTSAARPGTGSLTPGSSPDAPAAPGKTARKAESGKSRTQP